MEHINKNCHSLTPTEELGDNIKDLFYNELEAVVDRVPFLHHKVTIRDLNVTGASS